MKLRINHPVRHCNFWYILQDAREWLFSSRHQIPRLFTTLQGNIYGARMYIHIFFWIPYWPQILLNILRHPLDANQYGGHIWQTGSIFSCCKGLWDCLPTKPITTKHQSVFWLVSQSRRMSAIFLGSCR